MSRLNLFISSIIFLILVLIGLEMFARYLGKVPYLKTENFVSEYLQKSVRHTLVRFDDRLGWVMVDNLILPGFRTREFGLRANVDHDKPLPPIEQGQILAVGDSFAAGSEVTNAHSWASYLEKKIERPVYNGGVGAYGVDQIFERSKMLADQLKPETILFGFLTDDSLRNSYKIYGGGYKPYYDLKEDGGVVLKGLPVPEFKGEPREIGWLRAIVGHSYLVYFVASKTGYLDIWINSASRYQLNVPQSEGPKISCGIFELLKEYEMQSGIDFILFPQYGGPEIIAGKRHWYSAQTLECAHNLGLDMIDPWDAMNNVLQTKGTEAFKKLYVMHNENTVYGHMSPAGNELMADLLAARLK